MRIAGKVHPTGDWVRDSKGTTHCFDAFMERITAFHGYPAPGLVIGGKMVDLALSAMPSGCLFDAIAETGHCLPDAIQMLTPCTAGNGWLKVMDLGRFALALYDKYSGIGVRVFIHTHKVAAWKEIDSWFFKRKPKAEQDSGALLREIRQAGEKILQMETIRVQPRLMVKDSVGTRGICPQCGESYPLKHGSACRACQGLSPYTTA
ncbi:FmdE family protein [Desulfatitalea tepidiphila]|uniref:FmdE family protein n=1 Tax=Desulfatitalea tepidiphila TaxID=1185843 RepID=UPI0006B55489|nr:formylmethanofuran dehydrogenase subunit E family protein [Desulfatitalea tepidiphila]